MKRSLLCKKCHGKFDPETELARVLSKNDDNFWVCIFANDIGAPPKPASDKALHLDVDTVNRWTIEGLPIRYGHTSDPIGRVLLGWHIHWDDKKTFACASLATLRKVPFEAAAPFLLTAACQASLGTVNGVPDEISITLLGARDDTIGRYCSRKGLRDLLTRFRFFDAAIIEPIKRNYCRASNFGISLLNAMSTTTNPIVGLDPPPPSTMPTPSIANPPAPEEQVQHAGGNEDEEHVLEVEDLARQICELREKFENQTEAMDLIRGLMEEWSVKSVEELKAIEAPGANKIRSDIDRMVADGIIRIPDDAKQPKVDNGKALRKLVEFNLHQFPATVAKSFRDTVKNILEPAQQPPPSEPVECRNNEVLPSIGTSLVAVRATALRAATGGPVAAPVKASSTRQNLAPKRQATSLQRIHQALADKLAPAKRRYRLNTGDEYVNDVDDMTPTKLRKIIRETVQGAMQDYTLTHQQKSRKETEEEEKKSALFEAFQHFLANKQQSQSQQVQQRQSQSQQQQQQQEHPTQPLFQQQQQQQHEQQKRQIQPDTATSNPGPGPGPGHSMVHAREPAAQTLHPPTVVRASGLSTSAPEESVVTLADLNIFY